MNVGTILMTGDAPKPPPKRNISGLRPFVKGQSGNPSGRPKGIVRRDEVQALMGRFWIMDVKDIEAYLAKPGVTAGERLVASIVVSAIKTGDAAKAEWLLSRLVGKVKEEVEIAAKPFIAEYRDGTAEVMGVADPKVIEGETVESKE